MTAAEVIATANRAITVLTRFREYVPDRSPTDVEICRVRDELVELREYSRAKVEAKKGKK